MPRGRGRGRPREQKEAVVKLSSTLHSERGYFGKKRGRKPRQRGGVRGVGIRSPEPVVLLKPIKKDIVEAQERRDNFSLKDKYQKIGTISNELIERRVVDPYLSSMGILRQNEGEPVPKKRRLLDSTDLNDNNSVNSFSNSNDSVIQLIENSSVENIRNNIDNLPQQCSSTISISSESTSYNNYNQQVNTYEKCNNDINSNKDLLTNNGKSSHLTLGNEKQVADSTTSSSTPENNEKVLTEENESGEATDILARACSAVGLDSDISLIPDESPTITQYSYPIERSKTYTANTNAFNHPVYHSQNSQVQYAHPVRYQHTSQASVPTYHNSYSYPPSVPHPSNRINRHYYHQPQQPNHSTYAHPRYKISPQQPYRNRYQVRHPTSYNNSQYQQYHGSPRGNMQIVSPIQSEQRVPVVQQQKPDASHANPPYYNANNQSSHHAPHTTEYPSTHPHKNQSPYQPHIPAYSTNQPRYQHSFYHYQRPATSAYMTTPVSPKGINQMPNIPREQCQYQVQDPQLLQHQSAYHPNSRDSQAVRNSYTNINRSVSYQSNPRVENFYPQGRQKVRVQQPTVSPTDSLHLQKYPNYNYNPSNASTTQQIQSPNVGLNTTPTNYNSWEHTQRLSSQQSSYPNYRQSTTPQSQNSPVSITTLENGVNQNRISQPLSQEPKRPLSPRVELIPIGPDNNVLPKNAPGVIQLKSNSNYQKSPLPYHTKPSQPVYQENSSYYSQNATQTNSSQLQNSYSRGQESYFSNPSSQNNECTKYTDLDKFAHQSSNSARTDRPTLYVPDKVDIFPVQNPSTSQDYNKNNFVNHALPGDINNQQIEKYAPYSREYYYPSHGNTNNNTNHNAYNEDRPYLQQPIQTRDPCIKGNVIKPLDDGNVISSTTSTHDNNESRDHCIIASTEANNNKKTLIEIEEIKIDKIINPVLFPSEKETQNNVQQNSHLNESFQLEKTISDANAMTCSTSELNPQYSNIFNSVSTEGNQNMFPNTITQNTCNDLELKSNSVNSSSNYDSISFPSCQYDQLNDGTAVFENSECSKSFINPRIFRHRPASEPPVLSPSSNKSPFHLRPASLPPRTSDIISNSNEEDLSVFSTFLRQLTPLLDHLLTSQEASHLCHLKPFPDKLLANIVESFGGTKSVAEDPLKEIKENFNEVVKLCMTPEDLKKMGWSNMTPDQILTDLLSQFEDKGNYTNNFAHIFFSFKCIRMIVI